MNHFALRHLPSAVLSVGAALLLPTCASAQNVDTSDVSLTLLATHDRRSEPQVSDADERSAPFGTPISVEALVFGAGTPHPSVPGTQTRGFASAALGNFGVGVDGFFLPSNVPRDRLLATDRHLQRHRHQPLGPAGTGRVRLLRSAIHHQHRRPGRR